MGQRRSGLGELGVGTWPRPGDLRLVTEEEDRLVRELAGAVRAELAGSSISIREEMSSFKVHVGRHDRSCEVSCFWQEGMAGRDVGSDAEVVRFRQVSTGLPRTPPPRGP